MIVEKGTLCNCGSAGEGQPDQANVESAYRPTCNPMRDLSEGRRGALLGSLTKRRAGSENRAQSRLGIMARLMANLTELSREIVTAEVVRFWAAFVEKAADGLEDFYDPQAIVFPSGAKRSEPGRLTVARRQREYFSQEARLRQQPRPDRCSDHWPPDGNSQLHISF